MKKFGWIPKKFDGRDRYYQYKSKLQKAEKESTEKRPVEFMPFVYDQHSLNSCVANAFIMQIMIELIRMNKFKSKKYLSRLFSYFWSRRIDGGNISDNGTRISSVYKASKKYGIAENKHWKYAEKKVNKKPSFLASIFAHAKKDIFDYYWIGYDSNENKSEAVLHANKNGKAVIFGTPIFKDFYSYNNSKAPLKPHDLSESRGNHAMLIADTYERKSHNEHLVANSWGRDYGSDGFCIFHEDYVNWVHLRDMGCVFLKKDFLK
jgi:hypothetical protein